MEKRRFIKFRKCLTLLVVLLCSAVCASAEIPSDSPKNVSAFHSDGFSVTQSAVTLRFQCAPSSVCQVIVALTELGISLDDERFVKNGQTLPQVLERFACEDGS